MKIKSNKGFFIGDICYVLDDKVYDGVWGNLHDYMDGIFEVPGTDTCFAVAAAADGDGEYYDEEGNNYPVDAGVIGVVPLELVENSDGLNLGRVVMIPGTAIFDGSDGVFDIRLPGGIDIHIETKTEDE